MEEYPNNSDNFRQAQTIIPGGSVSGQGPREEKNPDPIVKGKVAKKKETFLDKAKKKFIKEDAKSVFSYVFDDILIPSLLNTFVDMARNAAEMVFLGGVRPKPYNSSSYGNSRIRYDNYFNRDQDYYGPTQTRSPQPITSTNAYDDLTFESEDDAKAILADLKDQIRLYGSVSISYYYRRAGLKCDYTANSYGWRDLYGVQPIKTKDGTYWLHLPRPVIV